jgi:hypothetical protein
MMGGAAFILLKAGQTRPESAKQAEIRLAILLKILRIARFAGKKPSPKPNGTCCGCIRGDFRRIWLIYPKSMELLSRSHL